jgi:hypothetical protein
VVVWCCRREKKRSQDSVGSWQKVSAARKRVIMSLRPCSAQGAHA